LPYLAAVTVALVAAFPAGAGRTITSPAMLPQLAAGD
jgi:hypothetical protein